MSSPGERDALPSGIVTRVETETRVDTSLGRSLKDVVQVFLVALRLGLTSFGGPIAHLGYFREEYVQRRQWLDEESYADVVALSQSLPGPASRKVRWVSSSALSAPDFPAG
jgi:Chromate transporter